MRKIKKKRKEKKRKKVKFPDVLRSQSSQPYTLELGFVPTARWFWRICATVRVDVAGGEPIIVQFIAIFACISAR